MVRRGYLVRLCAAALAAALGHPVAAIAGGAPYEARLAIAWEKDWKAAQRRARREGKPLLVDFRAAWCHWCHELDATTYRDANVVALARDFVALKVDTEGTLAEVELAARYDIQILPTIAFLTPGGRLFLRRTSFEGPDRFPATLETARRQAAQVIAWEAALSRNGDDAAALAGLGLLLLDQGLPAEGRDLLRRARGQDGSRPAAERKRTRRMLALAERQRGKAGEARKILQEALALQPAEPEEDAAASEALGHPRRN